MNNLRLQKLKLRARASFALCGWGTVPIHEIAPPKLFRDRTHSGESSLQKASTRAIHDAEAALAPNLPKGPIAG